MDTRITVKDDELDRYALSVKENILTGVNCFVESFGIGSTIGFGFIGTAISWAEVEISTPIVVVLTIASLVCSLPGFYRSYTREMHDRRDTIDEISKSTDFLHNLREEYQKLKINYMTHVLLEYEEYLINFYSKQVTQFQIEERKHIDGLVHNAILHLKNNVLKMDAEKDAIISEIREIYGSIKKLKNDEARLTESYLVQFLKDNKQFYLRLFVELENAKTHALNDPLPEGKESWLWHAAKYATKASANYTNVFAISGSIGSFTYSQGMSAGSIAGSSSAIVFAFLLQRFANYINHEVTAREDKADDLAVKKEHHTVLNKKMQNMSAYFECERYKAKQHLLEDDSSHAMRSLQAENEKLRRDLESLKTAYSQRYGLFSRQESKSVIVFHDEQGVSEEIPAEFSSVAAGQNNPIR